MWTKRFSVLLLFLSLPGLAAASSQTVFVNGGALFSDAPAGTRLEGTRPVGQFGARLKYTDLFTLQGAVSYQDLLSLEGALQFHPFKLESGLKPYLFAGFGRYLGGSDFQEAGGGSGTFRSVVPMGIGVEYPLGGGVALNLELGGRWTLATNNPPTQLDLFSGLTPTIGFSYDISSFRLPRLGGGGDDALPPIAEGTSEEGDEAAGNGVEGEIGQSRAGEITGEGETARGKEGEITGEGELGAEVRTAEGGRPAGAATSQDAPPSQEGGFMPGEARRSPVVIDTTTGVSAVDEMTLLPDGTFIMGLTDEDPLSLQTAGRKRITVSSFYLDKYEVSNEEYRRYLDALSPSERQAMMPDSSVWEEANSRSTWDEYFYGDTFADYPVVAVTHEQAQNYCEFYGKRLPTEAEWEYAARANQVGGIYPWPGFEPRNSSGRYLANYNPGRGGYAADGYAFTAPVDAYPSNPWGLYNVSGNVAEWMADTYVSAYSELSDFNPLHEDPEEPRRVVRGGSWASDAFYIGVGVRDQQDKDEASPYIGFRCAMDVAKADQRRNTQSQ